MPIGDQLLERMACSLQAWQRALGRAAAGGTVLELGALVGSVVPAAPRRSLLNAAAGPRGMTLEPELLSALAARYEAAGASAFGVWAHEDDAGAAETLAGAGLDVDSRPVAMALKLAELIPESGDPAISVERAADLVLIAEPLSSGYGFPPELLTHGLPGLLEHVSAWIARVDGVPAAGALIVRSGDDAGVFMVATAPDLRGRGAAGAVMSEALIRARDAGCTTSTLQASVMGRPVYSRLGYSELGRYLLWEWRG